MKKFRMSTMKKTRDKNTPKRNLKISHFFKEKSSTLLLKNKSPDQDNCEGITLETNKPSTTSVFERATTAHSPSVKRKFNENYDPLSNKESNSRKKFCAGTNSFSKLKKTNCEGNNTLQEISPQNKLRTSVNNHSNFIDTIRNKSPVKHKKGTPTKKLYEKSPKRLDEFNVQIINDFIKITPSKSNSDDSSGTKVKTPQSRGKVQCSILKFVSPSTSEGSSSKDVQNVNEITPMKLITPSLSGTPSSSRSCRTKLDFTVAMPSESRELPSTSTKDLTNIMHDVNFDSINFDDDFGEFLTNNDASLDFSTPQHCTILEVINFARKTVLKLKSNKTAQHGSCTLEGFWMNVNLNVNDTVYVTACQISDNDWIINNEKGLLVYEPDLLISCTSVVNTLFCKRKNVIKERLQNFEGANYYMTIGHLVHTLLQNVLTAKIKKLPDIVSMAKDLIKSNTTARRIYEANLKLQDVELELIQFAPKISDFIENYVENQLCNNIYKRNNDNWAGKIRKIEDIEENIWCHELGMKGKIDVTVKTDFHTLPLELKTGRATVSLEHRAQVLLYILMMTKLGYKVSSGLLLYLREGVLKEIPMSEKEQRDIIILRNELAHYLNKRTVVVDNSFTLAELPEPINNPSCSKCPYNIFCTTYLNFESHSISSNKNIRKVQSEFTSHLTDVDQKYFIHWCNLLSLEGNVQSGSKSIRDIYTLPPGKRQEKGRSIINVKIVHCNSSNGLFSNIFEKNDKDPVSNFLSNGIMEGTYVVVSTDERPAVASGYVTSIDVNCIIVSLDRNLMDKYSNKNFHLDCYDSSVVYSFNLTSLSLLLEATPRADKLRRIIIDKIRPNFKLKLPKVVVKKGTAILRALDKSQQRAVLRALSAEDFLLIQGMPGTGKTTTIVALAQILVKMDKTVLITSHTHSSIDNICIKLQNLGIDVMRLGNESRIHESLKFRSEHFLTKHCVTPEELEKIYNEARVIAVTCLGSGHPLLSKRTVDVCIVDESTQVLQTSVIRPLYASKTFILVGDPEQLPPTIKSKDAIKAGISESLFERLYSPEVTVALDLNYRMNKTITALVNAFTYNGKLLIGNETVANGTLKIDQTNINTILNKSSSWLVKALGNSLDASVQVIDTGPIWKLTKTQPSWFLDKCENNKYINIYEAAIVKYLVDALVEGGVSCKDIGVMATYTAQVAQISALCCINRNIDVSTVDQFQGRDKNVIIYSCSVSKSVCDKTYVKDELSDDRRRITVAISRAKYKLLLVGDISTLENYATFKKLLNLIDKNNRIQLCDEDKFNWEDILQLN